MIEQARFRELLSQINKDREDQVGRNRDSHIMIIDGLNLFIRVFSAIPSLNDDGDHVGGVVGFLRSLGSVIRQHKPTRCIVVFDGKGGSARRKKIYADYKANRAVKTRLNRHEEFADIESEQDSMRHQFQRIIEYLNQLPVTLMAIDNIEADDTIAYISKQILNSASQKITIVSTDRDFLQLVDNRIHVWSPVKKKLYTPDTIREEFGFDPSNYLLYRMFTGDASDNITGVPGVALKTLIKNYPAIVHKHLDIDDIKQYTADQLATSKSKLYPKIQESITQGILDRNFSLMQLYDVDIPGNAKMLILDKTREEASRLNVLEFKKMFMQDKLYTTIKDVDTWLMNNFNTINAFTAK